jgi:hypothetical protein
LLFLFKKGLSSSSINVARSALSFFMCNLFNLTEDRIVARLFRYFYLHRPLKAKYFIYWPVSQLLNYLSDLHPIGNLTLKQLTLKTLALIALTSSDRGQTLHLMNIEHTTVSDEGISFIIDQRLKTTRRILKPKVVKCVTSEHDSLNVCDYVLAYLNRTLALSAKIVNSGSPKQTQLFLSWATKRPVTKQTLARWLKDVLALAGIDTSQFQAHSYRGAGLSAAQAKGASIKDIMTNGDWKDAQTFLTHYSAPAMDTPVGNIILNICEGSEYLLFSVF